MTGEWLEQPRTRRIVLCLIVGFFAITNLPWTLDDYDQAKQAYTSFEMVGQGHWLYQHTPNESVATKPPLVGWISAALFEVTRWWEGAWRIPSLAAALALLWLIAKDATTAYGAGAGLIALSAFGLNLLSPRIATLVRTDMPLALVTFLIGRQIWLKIRRAEAWTRRDRAVAFVLLASAMLIKGPIIYAFILPGLIVYQILRRKRGAPSAWSGWWPWIFSLGIFLVWAIGGIVNQPGFYESVVVREFAGRFTETIHKPQPLYFYLPHLLHKFAPWSILIIGLGIAFWRGRERLALRMRPDTLWLVCWSVGGLVLMSIIPSKRVDRIYPLVPPLCLLLGAQVASARAEEWSGKLRIWLPATLIFACIFTGGYAAWKIGNGYHARSDALVRFSRQVRHETARNGWRYAVVGGREEGMLLYLRRDHFLSPDDALAQWGSGALDALVVRNEPVRPWRALLPGAQLQLVSEKARELPQYSFFVRAPEAFSSKGPVKTALDILGSADTLPETFLPNEPMEFPKAEIEALWCPWRVEYFELEDRNPNFLSEAAQASDDAAHLVITRRKNAFLMMNRYPYSVGHLMAVPYRKTAELSSLGENEVLELWALAVHAQRLLQATMKAQGFNLGLNLGTAAGAGVDDHLHLHIVPRWTGDTNFMPVLGRTRLLSEGLQTLYEKLMDAQSRLAS